MNLHSLGRDPNTLSSLASEGGQTGKGVRLIEALALVCLGVHHGVQWLLQEGYAQSHPSIMGFENDDRERE